MNESAHTFGPDGALTGVLTQPAEAQAQRPAVLFWNAGMLHHVGPNRLYVTTARRLAAQGFPAFRFDTSGLGDSDTGPRSRPVGQRAVPDVRAAMDCVTDHTGVRRFVLVGLCSGAHDAHQTAVADERVCGTVLLDGYEYRTRRFYLHHYLRLARQRSRWARFLKRRLGRAPAPPQDGDAWELPLPDRARMRRELEELARRGVQQLYVYTGGPGRYAYRRQFQDAFPGLDLGERLAVHFFPECDHLYTLPQDRERLLALLESWLTTRFAATPAPASQPARDAAPLSVAGGRI